MLTASRKYQLKQDGTMVELVIYKLQGSDAGEYSCDTGFQKTSAILCVNGRISFPASYGHHLLHPISPFLVCHFLSEKHLSMKRL